MRLVYTIPLILALTGCGFTKTHLVPQAYMPDPPAILMAPPKELSTIKKPTPAPEMKSFTHFIVEKSIEDEAIGSTQKSLINYIAASLNRMANTDNPNEKGMLLLIASISLLGLGDDTTALTAARRMAQLAGSKANRKDK
jgi:hypothetical protein